MLVDSDVGASSGVRSRAGGEPMIAGLRRIIFGAWGTFDFLWFCIAIESCWAIFSKEDVECVEDGE